MIEHCARDPVSAGERKRWLRVEALPDAALDLPPNDQDAFLRVACAGDDALHAEVTRLLAAGESPGDFLRRRSRRSAARR